MSKKKLTAAEINFKLQQAALRDAEDVVVEDPGPIEFELGDVAVEGWDEYVERVLTQDPPKDLEEEE